MGWSSLDTVYKCLIKEFSTGFYSVFHAGMQDGRATNQTWVYKASTIGGILPTAMYQPGPGGHIAFVSLAQSPVSFGVSDLLPHSVQEPS